MKKQLVVSPSDEALCNILLLPIVAKSSIINVAQFLDPPLKTLPYTKTSSVSCFMSFFLLFWNMATFMQSYCIFLSSFLQYDEVFLSSLLDGCYHYLVFMDPVSGYSNSKLTAKQQVLLKSKITFGCVCLLKFLLSQFSTLINLQLTCSCSVKATKPFALSISSTDIF